MLAVFGFMQKVMISLKITADEYLKLYRGQASDVSCLAVDGRTVRFPAKILTPYVTRRGIRGLFLIEFSDSGKFQNISKVDH